MPVERWPTQRDARNCRATPESGRDFQSGYLDRGAATQHTPRQLERGTQELPRFEHRPRIWFAWLADPSVRSGVEDDYLETLPQEVGSDWHRGISPSCPPRRGSEYRNNEDKRKEQQERSKRWPLSRAGLCKKCLKKLYSED